MTNQREIHINHGDLRVRLGELRKLQQAAELLVALRELLAFLERHFAAEEAPDSFFDLVREKLPAETEAVGELEQQHEQFLSSIEVLIERAAAGEASLGPDIGQLIRGLEAHEAIEHRLLRLATQLR